MKSQCAILLLCLNAAVASVVCAQPSQLAVSDFVRAPSFPRSYRELASSYDASAVPQLVELLNAETREDDWVRVAGLLGVVGDERAVDALIAFVEKQVDDPPVSREHWEAYRQAIASLGILAHRIDSERALIYLIDGLTPSIWRQRKVQGMAPWARSCEENNELLSDYALFGLAYSGHPRAGNALRSLLQAQVPGRAEFRDGLDDTLVQWLEVHALVAERGLAGMYEYYEAGRSAREQREAADTNRRRAARDQRLRDAER